MELAAAWPRLWRSSDRVTCSRDWRTVWRCFPAYCWAEGRQTQAATIYGAADQIRDLIRFKPWAMIRVFVDSLAVTAESTPENQAALEAGRQLSLEAAIDLAMDTLALPGPA